MLDYPSAPHVSDVFMTLSVTLFKLPFLNLLSKHSALKLQLNLKNFLSSPSATALLLSYFQLRLVTKKKSVPS